MSDPYQSPTTAASPEEMPTSNLGDQAGVRMLLPVGRSGWAIAAGYLGLLSLALFPAPLAFITSILAIQDINKSKRTGNRKHGMGRAFFGLLMGTIGSILLIKFILNGFKF
ncbi:hypothetical protein [Persicirhabdus sediminis]|uniref:DUF4190 domain-containing protein n=1 Tax=Persicirhabdus sediminis TaxID=454144 RepID=A0A8J7MEJ8_9BACT|nr:hypothetical protein [Persicirhabdus sediminis]MBK1791240.1 hypothetical protein [Persicirhabdus sediminis]